MLKQLFNKSMIMIILFSTLNIIMYFSIKKFWIGGSSFLPMIGNFGPNNAFLFAFLVNMGVIVGAFGGAMMSKEFNLKIPRPKDIPKAIIGGVLIGIGITLAPGTCTTSFVIGFPMLSISSFISGAGIFIGGYIVYLVIIKKNLTK
ncbi:MAG: hypothetical protein A2381_05030 [Bdellovibrionales bacterium RIFOXYB1_FULL_37_110]|nr:MAG: hypothetical protein A2417_16510 [Bdellovibrionales bacterium RIFOXYC1_FULL_37_79]OFZ58112.1 MAG: hypothetical protein A2381_05030 [Bdellovibrionales bacterium RIFOXYB1_FULL_37_110]OFZ61801.1 MAG: hypothetical protein A2577_18615 [Bdellovibrionales bacterium RIFOXYD1_FULL_36_51]